MILQFNLILALSLLYHSITKNNMDNSLLSNTLLYLYVFNYGGLIKMYYIYFQLGYVQPYLVDKYLISITYKEMYHYYTIQGIINYGYIV